MALQTVGVGAELRRDFSAGAKSVVQSIRRLFERVVRVDGGAEEDTLDFIELRDMEIENSGPGGEHDDDGDGDAA